MDIQERIKLIFKKKALHHASFIYFSYLINGVSLFVLNILLARMMNADRFGIFSLSILALSTVAELSDFGLNAGLLRFAPYYISTNQTEKLSQLVKTIWQWRVALTWVLTVGGVVLSYPLARYILGEPEVAPYLAYSFLGIGGVVLLGFLATFLQAKQRFFYNASLQSLKGILRLIIAIILLAFGVTNLFAYLSVYIFVPWLLFLTSYKVLPENFRNTVIDAEAKNKLHADLVKFSFWLTISSLMSIFATRIDSVMISRLMGLANVAIYNVAYQLIQFFPLIYSSINSALTPRASSLTDKASLIIFIKRTIKWTLAVAFGVMLFIYPSQFLIPLFFGQKYLPSMPVYLVLAYSLVLNIIAIPFSLTITVFNRTHLVFWAGFTGLLVNIVGNIILIPIFGIMGAAYTFGLGILVSFLYNIVCALYLLKKKDIVAM